MMDVYVVGFAITPHYIITSPEFLPDTGEYVMIEGRSYRVRSITYNFEDNKIYLEV